MTDYNIDFKDQVVEYPNRFRQVQVAPGIVDLIPTWIEDPSQVIEEGTPVNADLFDKLRANVTRRSDTFAATAAQTVFNLTQAYLVGQGRLDVYISGVKQRSGIDFTETSPTSFTLSEGLEAGEIVEAVYFSASQALSEDLIEQVQAAEAATLAANDAAEDANDAAAGALTANLNWKEPVNDLTALNALASPQEGDTRQTKDTGYVYRYTGTDWSHIQTMDPNAINALDTRLTSQLADTETKLSVTDQPDFVRDIQRLASHKSKMTIDILSGTSRHFSVNIPLSNTKGVSYTFAKNQNDDYVIMLDGSIGNINPVYTATHFLNAGLSGAFVQEFPPNIHTVTVDDSISTVFTGTKVTFYTYRDNRGGLWEFILNEGTAGEVRKNVSVYNATAETVEIPLFEGLEYKKHTLKAVFKGQDPLNPVATPRGWLYLGGLRPQDTLTTFKVYNDTFNITETTQALYSYSNKEFAISARPAGTTVAHQFIPEHNAIGTAIKLSDQQLYADGKLVDFNTGGYAVDVETVQLIQRIKGIHPSDPTNPLMEIITYHTIKNGVVTVSGRIKFLRDTEINVGYTMMLPYFASFAKKIKTSIGNDYAVITDQQNYKEYWVEGDKTQSFAILNDVDAAEKMNTVVAMTVDNFRRTNRIGKAGVGNPFSWIEHRNASLGKLYMQQFKDITIPSGEEYRFDGRFMVTLLPNVNELIL